MLCFFVKLCDFLFVFILLSDGPLLFLLLTFKRLYLHPSSGHLHQIVPIVNSYRLLQVINHYAWPLPFSHVFGLLLRSIGFVFQLLLALPQHYPYQPDHLNLVLRFRQELIVVAITIISIASVTFIPVTKHTVRPTSIQLKCGLEGHRHS